MSSNPWIVESAEATVAAATTKTILQIKAAGANLRERVTRCKVSIRGGAAGDAPVLVELLRQSSAGTASSITPTKESSDNAESLQLTAQQTFTAEPTAAVVLDYRYVQPIQSEVIFSGDWQVPSGGYLGVRATTQSGVSTITAKALFEGDE